MEFTSKELIGMLEDGRDDPSLTMAVATELGALGDPGSIPALRDLLEEESGFIRAGCCTGTGEYRHPGGDLPLDGWFAVHYAEYG